VICVRCHLRPAEDARRIESSVGTWTVPQPVCDECADELDDLHERCILGAVSVDRAVRRYRETLAA
jgi:hypothetical protein